MYRNCYGQPFVIALWFCLHQLINELFPKLINLTNCQNIQFNISSENFERCGTPNINFIVNNFRCHAYFKY